MLVLPVLSVLPVVDLKGGIVVRGVAGERAAYQAIRSQIATDASPSAVADALVSKFGFRDVYVADLDAIAGQDPSWRDYENVADCGLRLIIDAGIDSASRASLMREYANRHAWLGGVVIGLESIASPQQLRESADILGPDLAVFSVDLKHGKPVTTSERWCGALPESIVDEAIAAGIRRVIVLDLAAVGTGQGPVTGPLCRSIRDAHPFLEIISGGGVRSAEDVQAFISAGCNRVLVASALHDGRFKPPT
jgi:phosphoribosylformimino-5-aminoimidazole carboxamide ribotide isomerase